MMRAAFLILVCLLSLVLLGCGPAEEKTIICPAGSSIIDGECVPFAQNPVCELVQDVTLDVRSTCDESPIAIPRLTISYPELCREDGAQGTGDRAGCGRVDVNREPQSPAGIYILPDVPLCDEVVIDAVVPGFLPMIEWRAVFVESYYLIRLEPVGGCPPVAVP
jgi:hypothetical protein